MGIAVPEDFEPRTRSTSRSNLASATYTAIALVFFFGIGLAGGAAYKLYFGADAGPQIADRMGPPPAAPTVPAPQNFAAEKAAPDLARIEPSAPPALAPPPAPGPGEATKPHAPSPTVAPAMTLAPPPPMPSAAAPAQAPQAAPAPVPYAEVAPPRTDAQPETQAAPPKHVAAAIPPKKPAMVAKTHRSSPAQTVAIHPPPAAPGNAVGPYRVQFGAFANEDNARRVQWAVEATGLKVEVTHEPGPSGHTLFFLRSPSYPDYASALSAAQTVQHRVSGFVNAIPIDYAILADHSALEQQAQR